MSSHQATIPAPRREQGSGGASAGWKVVVLLLGIAVGVLAIAAVAAVQAADEARDEAGSAEAGMREFGHEETTAPAALCRCRHGFSLRARDGFPGDRIAAQELLPLELHSVQELNYQVGEFFDRALYHLTRGYEAEAAAQGQGRPSSLVL